MDYMGQYFDTVKGKVEIGDDFMNLDNKPIDGI